MIVTAAVARERREPLLIEELELDELRPDEVRVRMVGSGICRTDAVARDGIYPVPMPSVFGHEGSGVEEVGSRVRTSGRRPRRPRSSSATLRVLLHGEPMYCENAYRDVRRRRRDGTTAFSKNGEKVVPPRLKPFATYSNVAENSVVVVTRTHRWNCSPARLRPHDRRGSRPQRDASRTRILDRRSGTGAVGFAALMRRGGVAPPSSASTSTTPAGTRLPLGATHTVNPRTHDLRTELRKITGGRRVNYALTPPVILPSWAAADVLATRRTCRRGSRDTGNRQLRDRQLAAQRFDFQTVVEGSVPDLHPRLQLQKQGRFPFDELVRTYSPRTSTRLRRLRQEDRQTGLVY